ncbi:MAG: hypothetical protein ACRC4G_00010 [Alphaproteobacteria bacterium]
MIILFFIAFLVMGGASISEVSSAPWEDESEIPFSKIQVSPQPKLEKLLRSAPEAIDNEKFMTVYECYSRAQVAILKLRNEITSEILKQDETTSPPMAITQINVIWTGNPIPQHYLLRLLCMPEEKGRKLIVWGDSQNPPTHWEYRHDGEVIKEMKQFLSENKNEKRLEIILKVKEQLEQSQKNSSSHADKDLKNFRKIISIFEKVNDLTKAFTPERGFDDSKTEFARSFLTRVFFSSTFGSSSPFSEEKNTAELSDNEALLNQFKIKLRSCFRFQKEEIPQDLIQKFKTLQDAGKIEFRTLETLKTRSKTFFSKFLHQDLWDIINFERSDPSPNYAAVSDIARLIILCSGEANQSYEDLDTLTFTPNIPLQIEEQQFKVPAIFENGKIEACGNSFLVSGKKSLQAKLSLIEILRKYRFLKKIDLLDIKKTILKIHGTYWASGDLLMVSHGSSGMMKFVNLYKNPTVSLVGTLSDKEEVYTKLLFQEGNWK